jgi:DNA-binding PadR family transcriptional regulator
MNFRYDVMLTGVQFAILVHLAGGDANKASISSFLNEQKIPQKPAAFYRCMSRLEAANLVTYRYETQQDSARSVRVKWYQITEEGQAGMESKIAFVKQLEKVSKTKR